MWTNGGVETKNNHDKDVSVTNLTERSRLTNFFLTNFAQILHVFVCINLVPAQAGKVTIGLKSHRPCVTDNSGTATYGLTALEREMITPSTLQWSMTHFTFLMFWHPLSLKKWSTHSIHQQP